MLHVLGKMGDQPAGKVWTCQRVTAGAKCGHLNGARRRKCLKCGKLRPARKRPAHMSALDVSYAEYVRLNGGEHCGICGKAPKPGKRLHRDHDHRSGKPRGLLCWPCNGALRVYMTLEWLDSALRYVVRRELQHEGRLRWTIEDRGYSSPCWIWQRATTKTGYAVIRFEGTSVYVHRLMCAAPIPRGYHVDHLCCNTSCVNPAHLEPVTPCENNRRKPATRLTTEQVGEIRERRAAGETTVALAKEFGVTSPHISRMCRGLAWRDEEAA